MARQTQRDGWPLLAQELGVALVHPTPGVFFGPPKGLFHDFMEATLGAGVPVEQIDLREAEARFPLLSFGREDAVMLDHTAGVLAAHDAMSGLRAWLLAHGVEVRAEVAVRRLQPEVGHVEVEVDEESLRARAVVVATGAWLPELMPEWPLALATYRQQVGFVRVAAEAGATQVGAFPVWCRIGQTAEDFVYGLPEFGQPGLKLAHHRTTGDGDDPNAVASAIEHEALLELARARLSVPVTGVVSAEHCLYSVAPAEELRVARSSRDPRVIGIAACSGHGFKFGPMIGRQAADLVAQT